MSGLDVTLSGDRWAYRDALKSVSIQFEKISRHLSGPLVDTYKQVLIWYLENNSPDYVIGVHQSFLRLIEFSFECRKNVDRIRAVDVLNLKDKIGKSRFAKLAALIRRWNTLGYPFVEDAASLLKTLVVGAAPKGMAVLTMDPEIGPFSEIETRAIQAAVDDAYIDKRIDDDIYCMVWLFLALGVRPIQMAAMKVCDVLVESAEGGSQRFGVMVPRAKQGLERPRMQFKKRPLIKEIGGPLYEHAQRKQAEFSSKLRDPSTAPLFPAESMADTLDGFEFHRTSASLSMCLRKALMTLKINSERTKKPLNITPIRFRRTVGTRAAQEGHGELVIAEMLDHSDTQNVGIYVAAVPEIAARIDKAVAFELAPLAQAFRGRIVRSEAEAVRGREPESRILDLRIDQSGRVMGNCGQHSECHFAAPVACYTCRSFQPWVDGPHEEVLTFLLERRTRLLKHDERMASIHDNSILAVAQVIQSCLELRG
ncbi:MAG: site-specific integrase [Polaromonas sp.]|nr:site-specific integrase [Polaromonas sp.]